MFLENVFIELYLPAGSEHIFIERISVLNEKTAIEFLENNDIPFPLN